MFNRRKFYGEEFVLMSFCDGVNIKHMPVVKDFKKIKLGVMLILVVWDV